MFILLPIICVILFKIFLSQNNEAPHYLGNLTPDQIFFGLLFIITIASSPILLYKKQAKNIVMPEFIKYFGDFKYTYMGTIDPDCIQRSLLFDDFNFRKGDDYFSGVYLNTKMIISEENMQYIKHEGKQTHTKEIFKGIIIHLEMNKNFSGQTIVLKDKGVFNFLNKAPGLQKVTLEDYIFEKEFEVYSNDQLEARYLLTTAFMERILKIKNAYKTNKIQLSFFNNSLLIAVNTKKNMFESTSLFKKTTDRKMINQTFDQFISIMSIIELLKLHQKTGF